MRPGVAVLGLADGGLVMLDADADGEGFALHGDAGLMEEGKGVPGGVTGGQHEGISGEVVGALRTGDGEPGQATILLAETGELVAKADIAAQANQLQPDVPHHLAEDVSAHMGTEGMGDVLRCAHFNEGVQHGADAGIMGTGGQLAVREGACAALAELDVGGGVQLTGAPELLHFLRPLLHRCAPLQDDGGDAVPSQIQGGKQTGWPHAHHHGGLGAGALDGWELVRLAHHQLDLIGVRPFDQLSFPLRFHVHGEDKVQVGLFPSVHRLFDQVDGLDAAAGAQELAHLLFQLFRLVVEGHPDIADANHLVLLTLYYKIQPLVYHVFPPPATGISV